ncbi:ataxin-10-like [Penaeus monodon]|uniref:ataxin-10-like n=1 Tax=Penaeus monodon TaxID=6687 RepID=UPI0018A7BC6B|nr:ataxin-10-like [Penaeus monodon]XP_037784021.1 ataxin-10-like [Penaeus monodon]
MAECGLVTEAKEALVLYGNGDILECTAKLKNIQKEILHVDRWELDSSVIWSVCGVIKGEISKWKQDLMIKPSVESLATVSAALCCLRNSFANCSRTQLLVAETEDLLKPVISSTHWTFHSKGEGESKNDKENPGDPALVSGDNSEDTKNPSPAGKDNEDRSEWELAHAALASACVTCLGNMVAANPTTRKLLWSHVHPLLRHLLTYDDWKVSQMASMILHNCLLESELKIEFSRDETVHTVLGDLLTLYVHESQFSCFVLFCLELLLCCEGVVENSWPSLTSKQRLLCLDVLTAVVCGSTQSKSDSVPSTAILFLASIFKNEADKILCTHIGHLNHDDSQILGRLVNFVCSVAASDTWRPLLQEDTSLLITSVYLLRCMNDIGKVGGNAFTPIDRMVDLSDEEIMENAASHPAFGFKCDLIRLIASLVYRHRANQDQVREIEGLLLLLECTQFDARNPLIKEASIFALRNLLEGNQENQEVIQALKFEGVAENSGLRELGMEAVSDGDKVRLRQLERSPLDSDEADL